jgi:hypothetical protein
MCLFVLCDHGGPVEWQTVRSREFASSFFFISVLAVVYVLQCAVRAAVEGRILVLEGIEKAERNVLPVLNNLLENREMHLEDGRFLIPAFRYDKLLQVTLQYCTSQHSSTHRYPDHILVILTELLLMCYFFQVILVQSSFPS